MTHWVNEARRMHGLPELPPSELPAADDSVTDAKLRREVAAQERSRLVTLSEMMKIPQARAWMHDLLTKCGTFGLVQSHPEPVLLARLLGRNDVGQMILADLHQACPMEYLTMLKEANAHERNNGDTPAD